MTTSTTPTADRLSVAISDVQTQMGRVDTKASTLLFGSFTGVSVGIAVITKTALNGPATIGAVLTVCTVALAVTLLLTAVRPALTGGNHGFVRWAAAPTPTALLSDLARTDREDAAYHAHQLLSLSRALQRKYRLVRYATDLLRAALVLAALTAVLAATL